MLGAKRRIATYRRDGRFVKYTQNYKQETIIGILKSTLKIPPRHNGIIPIKIKGHSITGHMACFISDQESTKGKDPNITIVNGIHNIKGKTSVIILISNYSNKHVTFNKRECVGHLEPTIENIDGKVNLHLQANPDTHTKSSVTTKRIMSKQVKPDAFEPPCHKIKPNIEAKLEALLKEYASEITQDETSISTTPLTKMTIYTGTSESVLQKPYPITMKHYQWVKDEIEKMLTANVM